MRKDRNSKSLQRNFIAYDKDLLHTYMESAHIFKAKIYMQDNSEYRHIKDAHILEVNLRNNYFHLSVPLDLPARKKLRFRLVLEACTLDFITTAHASTKFKTIQLFSLPKQMTVFYERRTMRVSPSADVAVVAALFKSKGFITCNVLDISTRGMAVKVPRNEAILKLGEKLGIIELSLPGHVRLRVKGEVRSVNGERCGIKFLLVNDETQKKLDDYVHYRQLVKKISAKTYKNVEKELIKFMK